MAAVSARADRRLAQAYGRQAIAARRASVVEGIDALAWGKCWLRRLLLGLLFWGELLRKCGRGEAEALFVDLDGFETEVERVFLGGVEFEDFDAEYAALTAIAPERPVDVGASVCGAHFGGRGEFWRAVPGDMYGFGVVVGDAA